MPRINRRLVAAIACRNQGSRLYGKPLQNLDIEHGVRILDNIIECLRTITCVDEIVLGISEGVENEIFRTIADEKGLRYVVGDERDVLSRLVSCGQLTEASDIFRITSESPFLYFEPVQDLWQRHQDEHADATFLWNIIDGAGFEIFTLDALKTSHDRGTARHRSELCSLYVRENPGEFKVLKFDAPSELNRKDLRLTVDYPEDLIVCRAVYKAMQAEAPRIRVSEIVRFLDRNRALIDLTRPFAEEGYLSMDLWAEGDTKQ